MGGMEVGSVWGHGSYVAPDWTADWLHREAVFILDRWASGDFGRRVTTSSTREQQAQLQRSAGDADADQHLRSGHADDHRRPGAGRGVRGEPGSTTPTCSANGKTDYAIPAGAVTDPDRLRQLSAFFFWTSWAASTNRPDDHISYTNNWPHEPLVGNRPTGEAVVWTGVSIIMLLAGISAMVWW